MKPLAAASAEVALSEALSVVASVNPAVQQRVYELYEEDRKEFFASAQAACPSQDPKYWAKKSCSKCYGRGTLGARHTFTPGTPALAIATPDVVGTKTYMNSLGTTSINCSCTGKNYKQWLVEFRLFYNALRLQVSERETHVEQEA